MSFIRHRQPVITNLFPHQANRRFIVPKRHPLGELGPELITNGLFGADTDWTTGLGWTIGLGAASSDGQATELSQAVAIVAGRTYRLDLTTDAGTYAGGAFGGLAVGLGSTVVVANVLADGELVVDILADSTDLLFRLFPQVALEFIGDVDIVSLRQVFNPGGDAEDPAELEMDTLAAWLVSEGWDAIATPDELNVEAGPTTYIATRAQLEGCDFSWLTPPLDPLEVDTKQGLAQQGFICP